jgi:uncharacterized delta-60 repeat protein
MRSSTTAALAAAILAAAGPAAAQVKESLDNRPVGSRPACTAEACTWERTMGGTEEDKAYAVVATPDDGLIVAGNTMSFGNPRYDAWIARLDRAGETVWERRLGGPQADHFYALAAAPDGGVLAAGDTRSAGVGESDVWLARLDGAGEVLWQRVLGDASNDRARAALALPNGDFLVGGFAGVGLGDRDIWIARITDDGEPVWQQQLGGPGDDGAFHLALAADGDLLATGYWRTGEADGEADGEDRGFDLWAARLSPDGEPVWQRRFHRGSFDAGTGVVPLADGGLVVTGMTQTGGPGEVDVWVLRLDRDGEPAWQRRFGGARTDGAWAAIGRPGGGLVISAATASRGAGSTDAWMMGLDADGELAWERVIGGALWDRPTALAASSAGDELLVAGYTTTTGAGFEDFWLLRLDGRGRR